MVRGLSCPLGAPLLKDTGTGCAARSGRFFSRNDHLPEMGCEQCHPSMVTVALGPKQTHWNNLNKLARRGSLGD